MGGGCSWIGMMKFCGPSPSMRLSLSRPCTRCWSQEGKVSSQQVWFGIRECGRGWFSLFGKLLGGRF